LEDFNPELSLDAVLLPIGGSARAMIRNDG
jgi:hypothetical protein